MVMQMPVRVTEKDKTFEDIRLYADVPPTASDSTGDDAHELNFVQEPRDYLAGEDDPVLAELWDNDEDDEFDDI